MRSVKRHRPLARARVSAPAGTDLEQLAASATYIISIDHKDYLTEAGPGGLRSDASRCPRHVTRQDAEIWLRRAIQSGHVGAPWSDQPYPRYAWFRDGDTVYEARLSNSEAGSYKGYPLDRSEWPRWLE